VPPARYAIKSSYSATTKPKLKVPIEKYQWNPKYSPIKLIQDEPEISFSLNNLREFFLNDTKQTITSHVEMAAVGRELPVITASKSTSDIGKRMRR